jgi:hypothetical protein
MVSNYQKINNLLGWLVGIIASAVYLSTIEPTASFWDCGEYIATAYKLEVGHPPGAPLFLMIARFFSLFASEPAQVAKMINSMSALCSGLTILFLFWTITAIAKKLALKFGALTNAKVIAIMGSGLVGSLAYTFSDSFWFSAVEGEVYAMSSFFTAIVFWAILKWDSIADENHADRYIILIAYLIGLSIGVHLLNLLTIPAITFVYYFRKFEPTRKGIIYTAIVSLVILGVVQYGIIPGLVKLSSAFELFFVNTFRLPFNSGTLIYILFITSLVVYGLYSTKKKNKPIYNTIILCFAMIVIGYSSFGLIVIRSNANPPIDENNPENAISLLSYLMREQYGESPLIYGQYYNAPLDPSKPYKDGSPVYARDEKSGKYVIIDDRKNSVPNYDPRFCTIFPRMYSSQSNHVSGYKQWANIKGTPIKVEKNGEIETIYKPKFSENLAFFFKYQLGHMYLRYFMWNFAGRQNDIQGHGGVTKGNWLSGLNFLDEMRLGSQSNLPDVLKNNKGRNVYFMLPFLLGIVGVMFHFKKHNEFAWVVLILFLFTGLAINIYLNPPPYQPRERDYAYVGSFYAFAIWIGIGVYAIYDYLSNKLSGVISAIGATALSLVLVPTVMAKENWDDHDRSRRYTARDFAIDYLESCDKNAILFTNGDNDTFPLWYAQEVEGIRTDIRIINLSLANTDWYIEQLRRKAYLSDPIKLTLSQDKYRQGTRDFVPIYRRVNDYEKISSLIDFVGREESQFKLPLQGGNETNYFPTGKFILPVDSSKVVANGSIPKNLASQVLKEIRWEIKKNYVLKSELLMLDILATNNWERPIYYAVTVGDEGYLGLQDYFQLEGLAYRLVPYRAKAFDGQVGKVNTDIMYNNMMNKFKYGNMEDKTIYMDENNLRMTMNLRNNFARLADALIFEGKKDSALKVLDKAITVMPKENIPYNFFVLPIADAYYKLGKIDKGNEIMTDLIKTYNQELKYYASLRPEFARTLSYETQQAVAVLQRIAYVLKLYKQETLAKEAENTLAIYQGKVDVGIPEGYEAGAMEE